ncbi:MAG: UDP-3-O-acyl-N-acetylglucosamine deacetylase [candidate division WOR-3 bacterium]|nr:UDP-3-O-acyl-N-acetylglucosamine deacetylase [candidate division WOR-3 bacterium]
MKKYIFDGNCLFSGTSRVEIIPNHQFEINVHIDGTSLSIPYNLKNVTVENHTITIGRKVKVVEHLFSALYGLKIFNVRIDVFGEEIPFFDGSSQEFVNKLLQHTEVDTGVLEIDEPVIIENKNSYLIYEPENSTTLYVDMEIEHPYIGKQQIALNITRECYIREIAPARTFIFTDEFDPKLKNLPPYGIGITEKKIYASEPLRFSDEPVRHKILDLLGDIYVLRKRLTGRIKAKNTYHSLNLEFCQEIVRKMLAKNQNWTPLSH